MNFILRNWKTSLSGIIAFAPQFLQVLGVAIPEPVSKTVLAVFGLIGFLLAKDGNVSGTK